MKDIHEHKIIHRNLKLDNLFVLNGEIKLSDFGISKYIFHQCKFILNTGIDYYKSPQMKNKMKYSNKTDIWSAGVICYEIANKRYPFANFLEEIEDNDLEKKLTKEFKMVKIMNLIQI